MCLNILDNHASEFYHNTRTLDEGANLVQNLSEDKWLLKF